VIVWIKDGVAESIEGIPTPEFVGHTRGAVSMRDLAPPCSSHREGHESLSAEMDKRLNACWTTNSESKCYQFRSFLKWCQVTTLPKCMACSIDRLHRSL
jgi:hypothetical protein